MSKYQTPQSDEYQKLVNQAENLISNYQNPYTDGVKSSSPNNKKVITNLSFIAVILLLIGATFGVIQSKGRSEANPNVDSVKAQKPYTASEYEKIKQELSKTDQSQQLASVKGASDSAQRNVETFTYEPYGFSFEYQSDIYEVLETFKESDKVILDEEAARRFEKERNIEAPTILYKAEVAKLSKVLGATDEDYDLDKDNEIEEVEVPFRVYIYNNLDDLTVQEWFDDYHYFPYEWGDDTEKLRPDHDMARSDIDGEYAQIKETKQVKYIYFSHNQKMYLVWLGDLELASQRRLIGKMLASFDFTEGEEQILEVPDYNFSVRIPEGDDTIQLSGNRIEIRDKDRELIRAFTIFDANTKDRSDMTNWWSHNIYSEIGGFRIPNDYDTEQKDTHPHHINRNGIEVPTLIVNVSANVQKIAIYESSYYLYYDFGKPFILNYTEEASEDPVPQSASWPIITISPLD